MKKKERLKVYKQMLEQLQINETNGLNTGFCYVYYEITGMAVTYTNDLSFLKELWKYKPKRSIYNNFWFASNDFETRKIILDHIICELECDKNLLT